MAHTRHPVAPYKVPCGPVQGTVWPHTKYLAAAYKVPCGPTRSALWLHTRYRKPHTRYPVAPYKVPCGPVQGTWCYLVDPYEVSCAPLARSSIGSFGKAAPISSVVTLVSQICAHGFDRACCRISAHAGSRTRVTSVGACMILLHYMRC